MATAFKKLEAQLQELSSRLEREGKATVGPQLSAQQWRADVDGIAEELTGLKEAVDKIVNKAKETDPNKQVYGKNMTEKILALGKMFQDLSVQTEELRCRIAPLAQAEMDAEAAVAKESAEQAAAEAEAAARADEAAKAAAAEAEEARQKAEDDAVKVKAAEKATAAVKAAEDAEGKSRAGDAVAKTTSEVAISSDKAAESAAAVEAPSTTLNSVPATIEGAEEKLREQAREAAKILAKAAAAALKKPEESITATPTTAPAVRPPGVIKVKGGGGELKQIMHEAGSGKLVVVDFSASWCGPCRAVAPFIEQLAVEYSDKCIFLAVDCEATDANRSFAAESGIRAFPTFHFYVNSQRVAEIRGANREGILAEIRKHSSSGSSQPKEAMTTKLFAALQTVKANTSFEEFCAAARTLLTFVSNVIAHPNEPKYKRVRVSNARFHNALGCRTGGIACMEAVGFAAINEGGEQVLVMHNMEPELPQVKKMLEEAMVAAEAARPAPAATAAATTPSAPSSGAGSTPFGGLGEGLGTAGMGGLGGLNNPMLQQMMQNPAMMEMAQRAMQNPAMVQMAQQMMAGGQPPDMASIRRMMAEPGMARMAQEMMGAMGGMGTGDMPPGGTFGGIPPADTTGGTPTSRAALWPAPPPPSAPPTSAIPPVAPLPNSQTAAPAEPAQRADPTAGTGEGGELSEEEMIQEAIRRSMEDAH